MKCLEKYCSNSKRIFIYGAGEWGRILKAFLDENGIVVDGFIISTLTKNTRKELMNVPVYSLNEYKNIHAIDDGIVVAVSEQYSTAIISVLENENYQNYCLSLKEYETIQQKIKFQNDYCIENKINALVYHRVGELEIDSRKLAISKKLFEEQLIYIKNNYRVLRSDETWHGVQNKSIILTFDDGYADFYTNVLPLLDKYQIPATVFISTDCIDNNKILWGDEMERCIFFANPSIKKFEFQKNVFDISSEEKKTNALMRIREVLKNTSSFERNKMLHRLKETLTPSLHNSNSYRLMNSGEIRECASSPWVTIGCHTSSHCCLAMENETVQYEEIINSKIELEEIIGKNIEVFAYPYGGKRDFTDKTIDITKNIGFKRVFAAYPGMMSEIVEYGRIPRCSIATCADIESSRKCLRKLEYIYGEGKI